MLLKIFKNRTVSSSGTWGTKNENNYEILDFEFPEELEEYNKRIVYYLGNQKVWDAIIDNKAILTNAITTKGSVKAYIWCTKSDEAFETDVDFRTQIFVMNFFENENADGIVPTPEQVDGFNTMLTAMNAKIDEVDALEQTIETAEAQRQAAEATRVSNENTRESNESTRQTNEQTRQTQEAERERKTDEAIADIEDKTAEYNANAEEKTNEFNSNYTQKVNDFNTNATTQKTEFNSNAETKTNTFNTNATNKTNAFNSNASEKTTAFDNNASTKTSEFNTNAESKTSAFNDNATQKTTNFDNNASEKTDEFNTNAQNKIDEYDEHIVEYQAQIDELQEEVEELSENMPWNTTEQATEISVDDAAKYSKNKLELFGNTSQDSTSIDGGDEYDSPSPDHPQPIHVVTGENDIYWTSNENKLDLNKNYIKGGINSNTGAINTTANPTITLGNNSISVYTPSAWNGYISDYYDCQSKDIIQLNFVASTNYFWVAIAEYDLNKQYIKATPISNTSLREINIKTTNETKYLRLIFEGSRSGYSIDFTNINFVIQNHVILDLGSIELCKIGDYQDYLYKENGNWYVTPNYSTVINDANSFERLACEGDRTKFYYRMPLENTIEFVNFNYKQAGLINYGKVNQPARSTARGLYNGFNLGGGRLYLYTDEDSELSLEQFKEKWNEKLQNIPIQVYALKEDRTPVQITDETLIAQLDAIYEHLQLVKGTNNITVTAEDLAPYMELTYMQDLPSKLDNLDSRLALLE